MKMVLFAVTPEPRMGRNSIAQGNALGHYRVSPKPHRGAINIPRLQRLTHSNHTTQGAALGFCISPLWGFQNRGLPPGLYSNLLHLALLGLVAEPPGRGWFWPLIPLLLQPLPRTALWKALANARRATTPAIARLYSPSACTSLIGSLTDSCAAALTRPRSSSETWDPVTTAST